VSLRNLIPAELNKGFGFLSTQPAHAFAVAFTPDELARPGRCAAQSAADLDYNGRGSATPMPAPT